MSNISVNRLEKLGEYLSEKYIPESLPGCSILVSQNNEEVYYFQTGMRDNEKNKPIERDTIFRIYSMTKPITSMAIMILMERGLIKISDEVEKYIPEWKNLSVYQSGDSNNKVTTPPKRKMIIHDLLTHRSGLTYDQYSRFANESENLSSDECIKILSDIPLMFSPGEHFNYSISTDILGFIIERISKQSLADFFSENILNPLEMKDTSFQILSSKIKRFSSCYIYDSSANRYILEDDSNNSKYSKIQKINWGGAGLTSTIDDYMKFCNLIQNNGSIKEKNIIGSNTLNYMIYNQLENGKDLFKIAKGKWSKSPFKGIGYSLAGSVVIDPIANMSTRSIGEFSWGGAAETLFWVDKKENISVVFMAQMLGFPKDQNLKDDLRTLVYQSII
ncbi:MAG: serine hydrolase [Dehalococcoidales bacterium]|nr:serine hydrolase [Dehalococcoidales bacterium]